jgi:hypothetical protein
MAELITLEGKEQFQGKKVTGYRLPDNLDELNFPFKIIWHPNYKVTLTNAKYDRITPSSEIVFVKKEKSPKGINLITKDGYYINANFLDKNMVLISPETYQPINQVDKSIELKSNLNNSPLGKTARKIQIGFTVVGWGVFGILAYKFWNKSTTWKVLLSVFGAYNLYSAYKVFSKPALQVGDGSTKKADTTTKSNTEKTLPSISNVKMATETKVDTSKMGKAQKIDLIIKNQSDGEEMDEDEINNSKAFLNTLTDTELNIWISLSKALKDEEINKAMAKSQEEGFKLVQSKYSITRKDAEQQMKKLMDFLTKGMESAGFKVTEKQSMFSNFESSLDLDL